MYRETKYRHYTNTSMFNPMEHHKWQITLSSQSLGVVFNPTALEFATHWTAQLLLTNDLRRLSSDQPVPVGDQLFWCTAIRWMSISFSMTDRPQESHGAVLDPQILSCSDMFRSRSRTSAGSPPAWTVSPQKRHTINRKGQVEDWCWTWKLNNNEI